ncbi:SUEL-type lectin domain-containing protein [Mesorhizobium sp. ESP-6-4]|uniref:SUEL-type lectin domain-containing protein n=1 Tax=Mesorhizobium sp. ESP-6-4 TaxID=2876624 RepID=UPI001CCCCF48|nr:SUEL-type lectin domain-containing protein [Mesorhizobium sp. ESP-6-4]MBZ9658225.1 SUEL-type lectin domain-containing protein [Mesorhizobium sp. ESP-6-4]
MWINPEVVAAIAGTSGGLGVLALIAYFFVANRASEVRAAERSLRPIVEGYPVFTERQVLEILRSFKDEARRLEALRAILAYKNKDTALAGAMYDKIKANVDLQKVVDTSAIERASQTRWAAIVLLLIAVLSILYYLISDRPAPVPPSGANLISVQSAEYAANYGAKSVSILILVQRECGNTSSCKFACNNDHVGSDPAKGTPKHCVVNFTCSHNPNDPRHVRFEESETAFTLSCPG